MSINFPPKYKDGKRLTINRDDIMSGNVRAYMAPGQDSSCLYDYVAPKDWLPPKSPLFAPQVVYIFYDVVDRTESYTKYISAGIVPTWVNENILYYYYNGNSVPPGYGLAQQWCYDEISDIFSSGSDGSWKYIREEWHYGEPPQDPQTGFCSQAQLTSHVYNETQGDPLYDYSPWTNQTYENPQNTNLMNFHTQVLPEVIRTIKEKRKGLTWVIPLQWPSLDQPPTDYRNLESFLLAPILTPDNQGVPFIGTDFLSISIGNLSSTSQSLSGMTEYPALKSKFIAAKSSYIRRASKVFSSIYTADDLPSTKNVELWPYTFERPGSAPLTYLVPNTDAPPENTTEQMAYSQPNDEATTVAEWQAYVDAVNRDWSDQMNALVDKYSAQDQLVQELTADLKDYNVTYEGDGKNLGVSDILGIISDHYGFKL